MGILSQPSFAHPAYRVFTSAPSSVGAARRFLHDLVYDDGIPDVDKPAEIALVLLSELATNALLYGGGGEFAVTVESTAVAGSFIRVGVSDDSPELPIIKHAALDEAGGRGMFLVDSLASAWGVDLDYDWAKTVWFEL